MDAQRRMMRRVPFRAYVNQVQSGIPSICRGVDLSHGGICVEQVMGPQQSEQALVSLEFQLPTTDEVLLARGQIVHRDGRRVRVRFTNISSRHQAMLDGYLDATRLAMQSIGMP
ncbi:MAG: PilZ domain-containing protein [Myxococcota bacterium]|jgi:hypothetical protein|nr:PilZ domain-containing protein [Myxococcota bacterium]